MITAICNIEIYIYESNSLKDKRKVIKSLMNRIRERYNVSVSETDYNEKWNRAVISVAHVSNSRVLGEQIIDKVIDFIEKDGRVEITNTERMTY
ncbi:hypothetical protein SAMN02745751_01432 [Dethiosulfatibacter aminovorans DSM 17477]|uniref:DUF503 domain-containing protein n=1 Tax=Dethiosulfatibacter aminovorans DSM 17477 TaxID=1121476 RepID=A0A1M6FC26_9FIRM|nr:DUF503 domain-containing protein [Dethiosulfatibacter aminovorans]SHI95270.1 hypothetical protein SAMN02745751_01432 [Dethiosulfatibacter aminovorans DSM 17477]